MLYLILSAILLILSFPPANVSYFVFIAFVPLFFIIQNEKPKHAFFLSYICGFIFYIVTLYWLSNVTFLGLVVLSLYLAFYFGAFGWLFAYFAGSESYFFRVEEIEMPNTPQKLKIPVFILVIPILWVVLEYIQSYLFTGFGWTLLGYSQWRNILLIQIADLAGVYGVSFVIMVVNVAVWAIIKAVLDWRSHAIGYRKLILLSVIAGLFCIIFIFTFVYDYGYFKLNEENKGESIKVTVVQGNIPQEIKWNVNLAEEIFQKYMLLTKAAALEKSDLIVWPESSFPAFLPDNRELTGRLLGLVKEIDTPLLVGANTISNADVYNSAVLISREAEFIGKYDKLHLVPFGEYVPFSDKLPILHSLVLGELGEFSPGNEFKVFPLTTSDPSTSLRAGLRLTTHFSVLICYEDIFPELAKGFVEKGAEFLIVITNDAWYGRSGAPYQHAACSVFRAVENRVPVIRCTNTGFSCFIDSRGRIYDTVKKGEEYLFINGYKTSGVGLNRKSAQ